MEKKRKAEIVSLDYLRINRALEKECTCYDSIYEIDTRNRRVRCAGCGAIVEAFDALLKMGEQNEVLNEIHQRRILQKEQLEEETRELEETKAFLLREIAILRDQYEDYLKKGK